MGLVASVERQFWTFISKILLLELLSLCQGIKDFFLLFSCLFPTVLVYCIALIFRSHFSPFSLYYLLVNSTFSSPLFTLSSPACLLASMVISGLAGLVPSFTEYLGMLGF
ncbi:hypothetical protein AAHE18_17G103400 [Arachis hypogaea]